MTSKLALSLVAASLLLGTSTLFAQDGAPVIAANDPDVVQAGFSGCSSCQKGCGQKGCGQKGCGCGCGNGGCLQCCPGCCVDWCPYGRWCGHGKGLGWAFRCGNGFLPQSDIWRGHRQGWGWGGGHGGGCCGGGYGGYGGTGAGLFSNYYAPQGSGEGVATDMYPAPHDTPHPAIQTYYTYQPWLPHEHMYNHNRSYLRYYNGGMGRNLTNVTWGGSQIQRTHAQGIVH